MLQIRKLYNIFHYFNLNHIKWMPGWSSSALSSHRKVQWCSIIQSDIDVHRDVEHEKIITTSDDVSFEWEQKKELAESFLDPGRGWLSEAGWSERDKKRNIS
jgi:hypothetical protein